MAGDSEVEGVVGEGGFCGRLAFLAGVGASGQNARGTGGRQNACATLVVTLMRWISASQV